MSKQTEKRMKRLIVKWKMFISFEQVKEFPGEMELMIVLKAKKKKKKTRIQSFLKKQIFKLSTEPS